MEGSAFSAPAEAFVPIKETAGAHLVTAVPIASPGDTVAMTMASLADAEYALADPVWVVDIAGRLAGVVPLGDLIAADRGSTLRSLMRPPPPSVLSNTDQQRMATLAHLERQSVVPVADERGRFLGVVPPLAIIDVLKRGHEKDLCRMSGIAEVAGRLTAAGALPMWRLALNRLPWLVFGFAGSMLAVAVVARFEAVLLGRLAIAFFMPAVVYLAGVIGSQSAALAARRLSLVDAPLDRLLAGEMVIGALLGAILGALSLPLCALLFGDAILGCTVAVAILVAASAAAALGVFLPWLLGRLGADPAYGAGPATAVILVVLNLVIYLMTASMMLGR